MGGRVMFWLGTHRENWIGQLDIPLFVSHRRLATRKTLPRATGPVAIDSGGFTELHLFGRWETTPKKYAAALHRYSDEIGICWAAPQDWMCEPSVRERTGLTVREHQVRTIGNYETLRSLDAPVIPVLQGWDPGDYFDHLVMWDQAGFDLRSAPLVGLGTICRRQGTETIHRLVSELAREGIRLHLFGAKTAAVKRVAWAITSADSMAWSYGARRAAPLPGCHHKACNNCQLWALRWRTRLLDSIVPAFDFALCVAQCAAEGETPRG